MLKTEGGGASFLNQKLSTAFAFKKLKPEDFTQNMRTPILIDGRRIINPKEYSNKLKFIAIGLGAYTY